MCGLTFRHPDHFSGICTVNYYSKNTLYTSKLYSLRLLLYLTLFFSMFVTGIFHAMCKHLIMSSVLSCHTTLLTVLLDTVLKLM